MTSTRDLVRETGSTQAGPDREPAAESHPVLAWALGFAVPAARSALTVVIALGLFAVAPALFGLQSTTVMSGSMEPGLRAGDVVVLQPAAPEKIRVGQVLMVDDPDRPGRLRLHRLVGVQEGRLVLKGDANPGPDSSHVTVEHVRGIGYFRVPWVGLPVLWARTGQFLPIGLLLIGLFVLAALACSDGTPEGARRMVRRMRRWSGRLLPAGRTASAARVLVAAGMLVGGIAAQPGAQAVFFAKATNASNSFATGTFPCPYRNTLPAASLYYTYAQASGSVEPDISGNGADGSLGDGVVRVGGDCASGASQNIAVSSRTGYVVPNSAVQAPSTFSLSLWFNATTTQGVLASFGDSKKATPSTTVDRQINFDSLGQLQSVMAGQSLASCTISSPSTGAWHLAVMTYSAGTARLYFDGSRRPCSYTLPADPAGFRGYWRFGYDTILNGPATDPYFTGSLDETAVYPTALTASQVDAIYAAGH